MVDHLEIWRRTCRARAFELEVIKAHGAKRLAPAPFYLGIGQEHVAAAASVVLDGWNVFPQHRGHSWYLSYGGDPAALAAELLGRGEGCAGGMGGSASLHWPPAKVWGHSGLLGDQVPIAAGYALASGQPTVVVLGDAAVEEDYALATLGFAASQRLPILFLVEDNGLSILTRIEVRRRWRATEAARGLGLLAQDSSDRPWAHLAALLISCQTQVVATPPTPVLLNVRVCRHHWHAGPGQDGPPEWDTYADYRAWLGIKHPPDEVAAVEAAARAEMEAVWQSL